MKIFLYAPTCRTVAPECMLSESKKRMKKRLSWHTSWVLSKMLRRSMNDEIVSNGNVDIKNKFCGLF